MRPNDRIQQRLDALHKARRDLADAVGQARQLKHDLNPKVIIAKSVRQYPWRWAAGGVAAGWLALRMLARGKSRSGAKKIFTKGSALGMIIGSLGGLLRIPAEEFIRRRLRVYLTETMSGKAPSESAPEPEPATPFPRQPNRFP